MNQRMPLIYVKLYMYQVRLRLPFNTALAGPFFYFCSNNYFN
uniref:Uncharacterized protein n=1 Tax=Arundo donax TaxID=35708 RepID=A0A0A9D3K3_ARUDO